MVYKSWQVSEYVIRSLSNDSTAFSSSNSGMSPLFSECSGSGASASGAGAASGPWAAPDSAPQPAPSYNQRTADKMRADESTYCHTSLN